MQNNLTARDIEANNDWQTKQLPKLEVVEAKKDGLDHYWTCPDCQEDNYAKYQDEQTCYCGKTFEIEFDKI